MAAVDRTVRHLHLQAAHRDDARRAALRLEDALRCASLPDTGRRLLFVRRLDLGRVRADASAQTWALGLERALAQSALRWLPGDAPDAAQADVVWFRDALHAHLALGLRLARGPAPCEWFWPRLLPVLDGAPATDTALAAVMHALAALAEAAAALPAWVAGMAQAGQLGAVLAAMPRADTALLRRALSLPQGGAVPAPAAASHREGTGTAGEAAQPARALVAHALQLAGEEAAARRLLAHAGGALVALPVNHAVDATQHAAHHDALTPPAPEPATGPRAAQAAPPQMQAARPGLQAAAADVAAETAAGTAVAAMETLNPCRPAAAWPLEPRLLGEAWPWADGRLTAAGGALFLVPLLQRLGYADWLTALPEATARRCVAALWHRLFTRLALAPEDPTWALARDAGPPSEALPAPDARSLADIEARCCPAQARRAPWYRTTEATGRPACAEPWLALARRWLRRRGGLGLHELVLRPGWLQLSRTHADLVFDLDAVELRVRRAGLDLDPGWVPWLRRVVGFHYERLPWLARP